EVRRIVTAAVGVSMAATCAGMLLVFINRARDSAMREQCSMNLGSTTHWALSQYRERWGRLPCGTVATENLTPEQRLSWLAEILPYIEPKWYLDYGKPWDSEENRQTVLAPGSCFQCPANPHSSEGPYGLSHYVGIAGRGGDAAWLSRNDARAGVFG